MEKNSDTIYECKIEVSNGPCRIWCIQPINIYNTSSAMLLFNIIIILGFGLFRPAKCSKHDDIPNPALDLFKKFDKLAGSSSVSTQHKHYRRLVEFQVEAFARFGIHVPTPRSMAFIASLERPVVEIGSGSGYLANQLSQRGIRVVAVDPMPMEQTQKWGDGWASMKGHRQATPAEVYHPTVEMDAMSYLRTHDWCRGQVILLMNHVLLWLYFVDWDMIKSDAIVVSFSSDSYHQEFRDLIEKSDTWVLANWTEIPKYYAGDTRNRFQRIESWVRHPTKDLEKRQHEDL